MGEPVVELYEPSLFNLSQLDIVVSWLGHLVTLL